MATKYYTLYRRRLLFTFFLVILASYGFPQQVTAALDTGQRLPDLPITNFFENPGKRLRTAELKGKVVILDFWNIHCSACLSGMPEMDSLQQVFGDKIKILLVTKDKASDVKKLFDRIGMREKIRHLEVLTNDTVFNQLFPHQADPHHVWIDSDGIYRYGTFIYNATAKNIERMLEKQDLKVTQRVRTPLINNDKALIEQINTKINSHIAQYSIFLKEMSGIEAFGKSWYTTDSLSQVRNGFTCYNLQLSQLLDAVFNHQLYSYDLGIYNRVKNKRIIYAVKDMSDFTIPEDFGAIDVDAWFQKNLVSYEVRVADPNNFYKQMQNDVNNYLPYRFMIEKRKRPCYVISLQGKSDSLKVSDGAKPLYKVENGQLVLRNHSIKTMLRVLDENQKEGSPFFIDQTGIKGNINVTFSLNHINDPVTLGRELEKYGLKITKKDLDVAMLVVYDK